MGPHASVNFFLVRHPCIQRNMSIVPIEVRGISVVLCYSFFAVMVSVPCCIILVSVPGFWFLFHFLVFGLCLVFDLYFVSCFPVFVSFPGSRSLFCFLIPGFCFTSLNRTLFISWFPVFISFPSSRFWFHFLVPGLGFISWCPVFVSFLVVGFVLFPSSRHLLHFFVFCLVRSLFLAS